MRNYLIKCIAGAIFAGVLFCIVFFSYRLYEGHYWPKDWWLPIVIGISVGRVYAGVKISVHLETKRQLLLLQLKQQEQEKRDKDESNE